MSTFSSTDSTTFEPNHGSSQPRSHSYSGAMIPHPQHHRSTSYQDQSRNQYQVQPYHYPPQQETLQQPYQYQHQQPPYSRHPSHQSHHSHHSHHSRRYDDSEEEERERERERRDRELEKRPTIGDTLSLMWSTVVGALKGKRR